MLGPEPTPRDLEPWRALCAEAARVVWAAQTGLTGELAIALVPGPAPTADVEHRVVVGAYSPETRTVLVFIEALERVRRRRSYLRQMLLTLAHEVTHAAQHRSHPGLRPGRRGSATLDAPAYAEDPFERDAASEAAAFDHALFSPEAPPELAARVSNYRGELTARLVELIDALELDGETDDVPATSG